MHTGVYTKTSTETPTKVEVFSVQNAPKGPYEDSHESAHGEFFSVLLAQGQIGSSVCEVGWVGLALPVREAPSLSFACLVITAAAPLREVGSLGGDLPTSELSILVITQSLLGSNFSEKPLSPIGGWDPNGMARGEKGKGQEWLRGRGILGGNAEFTCTVGDRHDTRLLSPAERAPPQGKGQGKRGGKGNGKGQERKVENLKPFSENTLKCQGRPSYNWTTRSVCRFCGRTLPQGTPPRRLRPRPRDRATAARLHLRPPLLPRLVYPTPV